MNKVFKFFDKASQEALKSDMPQKHGAVIVKGGKVVVSGHNQNRTRLNQRTICSIHAEVLALHKLVKAQSYEKEPK